MCGEAYSNFDDHWNQYHVHSILVTDPKGKEVVALRLRGGDFVCPYYPEHDVADARDVQVSKRLHDFLLSLSFSFPLLLLTNAHVYLQYHFDRCYLNQLSNDVPLIGSSEDEGSNAPFSPSPRPGPGEASTSVASPPLNLDSLGRPIWRATISLGGMPSNSSRVIRHRPKDSEEVVEDSALEEGDSTSEDRELEGKK